MATNAHIQQGGAPRRTRLTSYFLRLVLVTATAGCGAVSASVDGSPAAASRPDQARKGCFAGSSDFKSTSEWASPRSSRRSYGWPLKPFNRQHPIRGYFNDPRNGEHGSHSFHFGIDIAAADGSPVYAVQSGVVHMTSGRAVAVVHAGGWSTAYWHIVPVVRHHQRVRTHQMLGRVEAPWAHVHFAERRAGEFVNPLRSGAIGPYSDTTAPTVADARFKTEGRTLQSRSVRGTVTLVADVYDTTPVRVPAPWNDLPVTPALVQWRIMKANRVIVPWRIGADFRYRLVRAARFNSVYAPATRKNYPPVVGRYCFYLARGLDTARFADGRYVLQIEALDTAANRTVGSVRFEIANGA